MQPSTLFSIVLPFALASQAAAQKSFCRAAVDSSVSSTTRPHSMCLSNIRQSDFSGCTSIRGVCTTACPRECGAAFKLQSVNVGEGACACFCTK
ncbi:hypothetical protein GCG54_00011899 [Colletotrichum gloeosporioides]|uniref:Uncharacterized protein n=1 Tax=Colletotrichum gloeosporioides TaxID=474922 RepID=A0A8H4FCR8_COLGL|nr:uncharacterized protein GCG54_00011899 [Colletotrichum gloeosporioides]KAF3797807.1 hypothetical protein GCG54_00011899 [Colletotrichum gloeosporioides]